MPLAHAPRNQQRIRFGRGPQALHVGIADTEQRRARDLRINHRTADEVGGRAGDREQSRGDQSSGRGFGNGDGLAALDQTRRYFLSER